MTPDEPVDRGFHDAVISAAGPGAWPTVRRWCDWTDEVLATPGPVGLVHSDLHGDNQVWQHDRLVLVLDFEPPGWPSPGTTCAPFPDPGWGRTSSC